MSEYEVPIVVLPGCPSCMIEILRLYAGVKVCARDECDVHWVGGHGGRKYCSIDCRDAARTERRKGD